MEHSVSHRPAQSSITVASFDVFDTMLTRLVGTPHSVFLLLGRQLITESLITTSADAFQLRRVHAEEHARRLSSAEEVTIDEIYDVLASWYGWSGQQRSQALELEVELERLLLRPVPEASHLVQQARDRGERVVFTSDMYLPGSFVAEHLRAGDLWRSGDGCYVSSDIGKMKQSISLFQHILEQENVTANQLQHWGDNQFSDIQCAQRAGIKAHYYSGAKLNRFEEILERYARQSDGLTSIMAGASRMARLNSVDQSEHARQIASVSAGVAAPALTGYVLWVLRRARDRGLQRLYFVSRDGAIMLEIAKLLTDRLGIDVECRYLHGSRQAWHLPSLSGAITETDLTWIMDPGRHRSVTSVLTRLGLDPQRVRHQLESAGLATTHWDHELSESELSSLCSVIQHPDVEAMILEVTGQRREVALDYFQQEGLFDSIPMGIVDLGWRGQMFNSLSRMLEHRGGRMPVPFLFGFSGSRDPDLLADREVYLFDDHRDDRFMFSNIQNLMEVFCSGYEGRTNGYQRTANGVEPVLSDSANAAMTEWGGIPEMKGAVNRFATEFRDYMHLADPEADVRHVVFQLLSAFWEHPNLDEARAWGSFPYEDDQSGLRRETLAAPFTSSTLPLVSRLRPGPSHWSPLWYHGSLVLSNPMFRQLAKARRFIGIRRSQFREMLQRRS